MFKKEEDFVINLKSNKNILSPFLISDKEIKKSKNEKKYLQFTISDKTGHIPARYFTDFVEDNYNSININNIYQISGRVSEFPRGSGKFSVIINKMNKLSEGEYSKDDFLRVSSKKKDDLLLEITKTMKNMTSPYKNLLNSFFNDESFLEKFKEAPAARYYHHNYLGGLLEHTVEVLQICKKVSEIFPELNKDLLYTGAILHDIGKMEVYDYSLGGIIYSEKGKLLDHIFISADMVKNKMNNLDISEETADQILHLILSHHGDVKNGWGSPVSPQTPEAITLHYADNLDAKVMEFYKNKF